MCVAAVIGLAGSLISGIGAMAGMKHQEAMHKANAQNERMQAQIEREAGAHQAERKQDELNRIMGEQRAAAGANGVAMSGSAIDTYSDTATEGALDIHAIRWNSRLNADRANYRAKMEDMSASSARRAAPIAFLGPALGGAARFASSFGDK